LNKIFKLAHQYLFKNEGVLQMRHFLTEIVILFCFILLINNYVGNVDKTINADGIGYYDYLPSIFIHHDILRKDNSLQEDSLLFKRIISTGVYVDYNEDKVNKYPCGTALLQLPFFAYTYLTSQLSGNTNDGYQRPFQRAIFHAAIFYLFLSILFLKKILVLYEIDKYVIIFCQLTLVFSTSVTHYANYDAGFSHVYSLFAITAFFYFIKSFLLQRIVNHFILACLFLGLIFILRQLNILVVLFIPFLAGSTENLKVGVLTLFSKYKSLQLGIAIFIGVCSIQFTLWYLQTGHFFVYSYQGESFDFSDPHFYSILFSYKKGLFIYTPILLFTLVGLAWFTLKKQFYLLFTCIAFLGIITFILSSWWSWYYGCSFGLRAYIDYYSAFFIPFAILLNAVKIIPRTIIIILALPTIPLNIIQTYQYKEFILHWIDMDKEKYWKVFLKTDDRFKGMVWKNNFDSKLYSTIVEMHLGDMTIAQNSTSIIININSREIPDFDKSSSIQVLIDNDYQENSDTKITLSIDQLNKKHNYYWDERYLIQFHEKFFNEWQTGFFNFELSPINAHQEKTISLIAKTGSKSEYLKNIRLKFLSKK
jgi:hypothetical protein